MDFDKLKQKAQQVYTERGGSEAAKGDGQELKDIFQGDGTLGEKAKAAAQAMKEPGAHSEPGGGQAGSTSVPPPPRKAAGEPAAPPTPDTP